MRIEALRLEHYGAFAQRNLQLGGKAPLTVVYGPNEAGKSTSLSAVKDFLFGLPNQTPRMAVFGGDAIRLSATLRRADGTVLTLRRRKGRVRTLTDEGGAPVDDAALGALLGGTTRDKFETLFGLDHETLRKGGAQLLTAEGEIGRLIIEAGGGLRGLVQRLERVDAEIDKLFSTRRSAERAFYKARDTFDAADRAVKAGTVTWEQYGRARQAHEAAMAEVQSLRDSKAHFLLEVSRLERLVRVVPTLRKLDWVRAEIEALAGDRGLPSGFDKAVEVARNNVAAAEAAADAARLRRSSLKERLQGFSIDPTLEALEAEVREIASRSIHVAKQREDRPNRLKELADASMMLDGLRRRLRLAAVEDLAPRLPAMEIIERVQTLTGQAQRREPEVIGVRRDLAELEAKVHRLREAVAAAMAKGQGQAAGITVAELASLPSVMQQLAVRRSQAERVHREALDGLARLGFEDFVATTPQPFPSAQAAIQELIAVEQLRAARLTQVTARAAAEAERDVSVHDVERLTSGEGVANDEALQSARQLRTEALAPIWEAHLAGAWAKRAEVRAKEVENADKAIAWADQLADRHAAEAHRAAELAQAIKRCETAKAQTAAAERAIVEIDAELARRLVAFQAAFPYATKVFAELPALKAAAEQREELLDSAGSSRTALDLIEADETNLVSQLQLLEHAERICGLGDVANRSIGERVRDVLTGLTKHEQAFADCQRDHQALAEAEASLVGVRESLSGLEAAEAKWRAAWTPALQALGLPAESQVEAAAAAAMEWASAVGVLTTIEATQRRIKRMDEDEAELEARVSAVVAKISLRGPEDSVATAGMIQDRWEALADARRQRDALTPELKSACREVEIIEAVAAKAAAELNRLAGLAGVAAADSAKLDTICDRLRALQALQADEQQLVMSLQAPGDGLPENELRAAWMEQDFDAIRADLATKQERSRTLESDLEQAIEGAVAARGTFEAHHEEIGVNGAAAARESAVAKLHDVVERYVDLSLARDLLKNAIAKVRARQQDPLVARAGELFGSMTRGAYLGITADIDAKGEPVVAGVNPQGATVPVQHMSDGARDQLYLAFRLAGLESYCRSTEPLPFIADDILVHFDDPRTEATLEVLAEFCGVTQVLLFTHHLSVRRAAEALVASGKAEVVELV